MNRRIVEEKLNELPETLQEEVLDFIEFLINKNQEENKENKEETFNFNWEAGLLNCKNKYTSVDLQHASTEWR